MAMRPWVRKWPRFIYYALPVAFVVFPFLAIAVFIESLIFGIWRAFNDCLDELLDGFNSLKNGFLKTRKYVEIVRNELRELISGR